MTQRQIQTRIQYGGQTSAYETAATVNTVLARVQGLNPTNNAGLIYDYGLGEGDYPVNPVYGPYDCGIQVDYNVVDFDFLKHWIGPRSGSGTSGSPYILTEDNVVGLNTSDIQPFTLEIANVTETTATVDTYIGCVGNAFTLSADLNRILRCSATAVARRPNSGTTATSYTPSTTSAFTMINGAVKWGGTPSLISGVQSFQITHSNGIIASPDITDRFIKQPYVGQKSYTFRFTIKMGQAIASTIIDHFYGKANQPEDGATSINPTSGVELKIELVNASRGAILWLDECTIGQIEKIFRVGEGLVMLTVSGTSRGGKSSQPIQWWNS